jgi:iron(III) transport system permease protein
MSKRFTFIVCCTSALFFACFFIWPIFEILHGAFWDINGEFTLSYFKAIFANPVYMEGFQNAFGMAVCSTIFTTLIAVPLAIIMDRYPFPAKNIFSGLILLPIMLPPFVGAIGIRQVLGEYGILNTLLNHLDLLPGGIPFDWIGMGRFWGVVVLNGLSLYPILYLNCLASLSNM